MSWEHCNSIRVVWWEEEEGVGLLDQTLLPLETKEIVCEDLQALWEAIKMLRVRGAPAIGVAAAYGVVLAAHLSRYQSPKEFADRVREGCRYLATSRPTAVNLFWALARMERCLDSLVNKPVNEQVSGLLTEARLIQQENDAMCLAIANAGAEVMPSDGSVFTHCNAGGLACGNFYGTALGVIIRAHELGKKVHVYVDETRPLMQGSRLTTYELDRAGVPFTLIADNMAAHVMSTRPVDAVVFGADRIAANGDTANKIGSYGLAVIARAHNVPVYVTAPRSTVDFELPTGREIPIEERSAEELHQFRDVSVTCPEFPVYNPAFDVTPADLLTGIITEVGVLSPPFEQSLNALRSFA